MRRIFTIITLLSLVSSNAFAWSDKEDATHQKITEKAVKNSNLEEYLLKNLDIYKISIFINGKRIDDWLRYGSKEEDSPLCRASNHFHDPTKEWHESGLSTLGPIVTLTFFGGKGLFGGEEFPPSTIKSNIFFATGYLWQQDISAPRLMVAPFVHISQIAADMHEIKMVHAVHDTAKYRIMRQQERNQRVIRDITYYVYFELDENGIWTLERM